MSVTWLPQQFSQVAWHTRHRAGPHVSYTCVGLLQERWKSDSLLCSGICGLLSLRPARACMQGTQFSYLHKVPHLCKQLPTLTARAHLGRVMASALRNETPEQRAARKEQIKAQKADKRARCQIDKTEQWHMVCGKCWKKVSGGVVDGDDDHPDYRYGGLWKNLHKADKLPDSLHEGDIGADSLDKAHHDNKGKP